MGILDSFNIGAESLSVHGQRLEVHAKNVANVDTPNYIRKIPLLASKSDISFDRVLSEVRDNNFSASNIGTGSNGVIFKGIMEDPTPGELLYKPGHPDADANGYIKKSNVNPMVDMADALLTSKAYQANMAVVTITKTIAQKALEIGR